MALVLLDRAKETTVVLGTTANAVLLGATTGYQSFANVGDGNTTYYCIAEQAGANWEIAEGTYTLATTTITRDATPISSSNAGAAVNFSAGTKDIFIVYPASKGVWLDSFGNAVNLGTPVGLVGTNITGTATAFTASNVTTNANLTGAITSVGNATSLNSFTSLQLLTALTDKTGTGTNVFATSPTIASPTYTGTLTGSTGIVAIGTSQIYKDASGNVGIGVIPAVKLDVASPNTNSIIRVGDYTANATLAYPLIEAFGSRQDANSTFFGRFGASKRRADGTAIPSGQAVGVYAFGGQWGTDTSYQSAKHLYAASIMGISESSFASATTMSTAIVFNTGSTGSLLSAFNTGYGTERMRITSTGGVNIGASTDPGLGNLNIVGATIVGAVTATSAAAPTIASATTIAPTKAITFISGVTPIVTITPPSPISLGGGTITLIPTGIFTTTIAGNIALASTAVVGRALTMTYDVTTTKWYPSY